MKVFYSFFFIVILLAGCSGANVDHSYPQDIEDTRREKYGKMGGEDGIELFSFGKDSSNGGSGKGGGIGVNSFLWRATLDTLSFMPLASADPFGGVIITDWYEATETPGERFKLNVLIMDKALRSDAVKISVFKQQLDPSTKEWQNSVVGSTLAQDLENKILARARELRVSKIN